MQFLLLLLPLLLSAVEGVEPIQLCTSILNNNVCINAISSNNNNNGGAECAFNVSVVVNGDTLQSNQVDASSLVVGGSRFCVAAPLDFVAGASCELCFNLHDVTDFYDTSSTSSFVSGCVEASAACLNVSLARQSIGCFNSTDDDIVDCFNSFSFDVPLCPNNCTSADQGVCVLKNGLTVCECAELYSGADCSQFNVTSSSPSPPSLFDDLSLAINGSGIQLCSTIPFTGGLKACSVIRREGACDLGVDLTFDNIVLLSRFVSLSDLIGSSVDDISNINLPDTLEFCIGQSGAWPCTACVAIDDFKLSVAGGYGCPRLNVTCFNSIELTRQEAPCFNESSLTAEECFGLCTNDEQCSGNGRCTATGVCECAPAYWHGRRCSYTCGVDDCNQGQCLPTGECECDDEDDTSETCVGVNGTANDATSTSAVVASSSTAANSAALCPNDCTGNGDCYQGKCICNVGFYGDSCQMTHSNVSGAVIALSIVASLSIIGMAAMAIYLLKRRSKANAYAQFEDNTMELSEQQQQQQQQQQPRRSAAVAGATRMHRNKK